MIKGFLPATVHLMALALEVLCKSAAPRSLSRIPGTLLSSSLALTMSIDFTSQAIRSSRVERARTTTSVSSCYPESRGSIFQPGKLSLTRNGDRTVCQRDLAQDPAGFPAAATHVVYASTQSCARRTRARAAAAESSSRATAPVLISHHTMRPRTSSFSAASPRHLATSCWRSLDVVSERPALKPAHTTLHLSAAYLSHVIRLTCDANTSACAVCRSAPPETGCRHSANRRRSSGDTSGHNFGGRGARRRRILASAS